MKVDQNILAALDPKGLNLPPRPVVEAIDADFYEDTTGEDSLAITVVLHDDTKDEDITGENVVQIKSAIRESLLDHGILLFPYVRMLTRTEYESQGDAA